MPMTNRIRARPQSSKPPNETESSLRGANGSLSPHDKEMEVRLGNCLLLLLETEMR
jgi:hypothetical protein